MSDDKSRQLPRPVIALAVLITGAATIWALTKSGPLGPYTAWERAQHAVQQVWTSQAPGPGAMPPGSPQYQGMQYQGGQYPEAPYQAVPAQNPQMAPADPYAASTSPQDPSGMLLSEQAGLANAHAATFSSAARTVGLPGVPAIMWGATRPHPDRGACTTCHNVMDGEGGRVPDIQSFSVRPHGYRGVCSNCHNITVLGMRGNPVAATRVIQGMGGEIPVAPTQPRPPATEAEWLGTEVRAAQQGVVITNVDGVAARAGVQPGDVVDSLNGIPVADITAFEIATQNGKLRQGAMIARRGGQRIAFELNGSQLNNAQAAWGAQAAQPQGGALMGSAITPNATQPITPTPNWSTPGMSLAPPTTTPPGMPPPNTMVPGMPPPAWAPPGMGAQGMP